MSRIPFLPFVRFAGAGLLVVAGCSRSGAGTERSLQDPASTAASESSPATNVPQAARTAEAPSATVAPTTAPAVTAGAAHASAPAPHAGHGHTTTAPTAPPSSPASAATPAATAAAKATYSCPMHPEVQKDSPGSCPKCGMNLVKK